MNALVAVLVSITALCGVGLLLAWPLARMGRLPDPDRHAQARPSDDGAPPPTDHPEETPR